MNLKGSDFVGRLEFDKVFVRQEAQAARAIGRVAQLFIREVKILISRPGPTKTHRTGTVVGGETIRASREGEPPRRRTGILRASIKGEPIDGRGLVWKVGTVLGYGRILETVMKRPYLRSTLARMESRLSSFMAQELGLGG